MTEPTPSREASAQLAQVFGTHRPITARLIVRRVKDLNRKAAPGQAELFTAWRRRLDIWVLLIWGDLGV